MHHKVGVGEERRKVLSVAEGGVNCAASKRLGGAHHALNRIGVVDRDVRTCHRGECSRCLTGAPATENDDVAATQAPRCNGWRLKVS
jgi:hypothetical protein